jgi:YD repeat-containing protein
VQEADRKQTQQYEYKRPGDSKAYKEILTHHEDRERWRMLYSSQGRLSDMMTFSAEF